jgi:UDP-3-O-[3-hydroxymyristoyl] N-acetylglucosamine deacetylase
MTNDKGRYTLGDGFTRSGIGLHNGIETAVRVLPAAFGEGRYFVRIDLPGLPAIPAVADAVSETTLSTQLQASTDSARVRTVEHLLAALAGSGVDDARIEIDGSEVPLLDGSALSWVEAIGEVGVVAARESEGQPVQVAENLSPNFCLEEPIWVYQGDAFVAALPAPVTRFTYGIDFDLPAIGKQWYSWTPGQESFAEAVAPARTFGLAPQIDRLRDRGLIKGGSLENALVCDERGWLNPPLRFSNEPVRHKLLDLVGDLSLLGTLPVAHFLAYKASHSLHVKLVQQLACQIASR